MSDVIWKDQEVLRDVQRLTGPKENRGELRRKERVLVAARAVKQENCIVDEPCAIPVRCPQREIVQVELRNCLASTKAKILRRIHALHAFIGRGSRFLREKGLCNGERGET